MQTNRLPQKPNCTQAIHGNVYDKYRSSNPIARYLVSRFLKNVRLVVARTAPSTVLDVGCADGTLADLVLGPSKTVSKVRYTGIDVSPEEIGKAQKRFPNRSFLLGSAYDLPVPSGSVELVWALEVLEHLDKPDVALGEIARVSNRFALVSVPWEPVWRIMNVLRGAYLSQRGNTPGHLQHFSRVSIRRAVMGLFHIECEYRPFPWTMLLLRKR